MSNDGTRLYVAANPGALYVVDTSNGAIIASVGGFRDAAGMGLNGNESVAYVLANRFDRPSGTVVLFFLPQRGPWVSRRLLNTDSRPTIRYLGAVATTASEGMAKRNR